MGKGINIGKVRISNELRELVHFKKLNLIEEWPVSGPFDLIFCRNVVIDFDKTIQKKIFEEFSLVLVNDGYLFTGHSESLFTVSDKYKHLGQTIHRKVA